MLVFCSLAKSRQRLQNPFSWRRTTPSLWRRTQRFHWKNASHFSIRNSPNCQTKRRYCQQWDPSKWIACQYVVFFRQWKRCDMKMFNCSNSPGKVWGESSAFSSRILQRIEQAQVMIKYSLFQRTYLTWLWIQSTPNALIFLFILQKTLFSNCKWNETTGSSGRSHFTTVQTQH